MKTFKSITFLFCLSLFMFSCMKDKICHTAYRVKSVKVISPLQNDSFVFIYNTDDKIKEVQLNGLPYLSITALSDTELQVLDFTDTLSGTLDSVWCVVKENKIQYFKKRFGTLYSYIYNNSGTVDSVRSYSGGEYYNYTYTGTAQMHLNYTQRYHTICGFNTPCSKYFRDSVSFEKSYPHTILPDQFIYQDFSEVSMSYGIPYKYILHLNGYTVQENNGYRITKWSGVFTPIFIPLDAVRYTIKYLYSESQEGQINKMRMETYDETSHLVFFKEYYFYYEKVR